MRVIPNLDRKNLPGAQILKRAGLIGPAPFLHFLETAEDLPLGIENSGRTGVSTERLGPGREQGIFRYRHLRQPAFAATLPALFL